MCRPSQEFAWAEEDLPLRVAERGSSLSKEAASKLSKEPMWCFEVHPPPPSNDSLRTVLCVAGVPAFALVFRQPPPLIPVHCGVQTSLKMMYW